MATSAVFDELRHKIGHSPCGAAGGTAAVEPLGTADGGNVVLSEAVPSTPLDADLAALASRHDKRIQRTVRLEGAHLMSHGYDTLKPEPRVCVERGHAPIDYERWTDEDLLDSFFAATGGSGLHARGLLDRLGDIGDVLDAPTTRLVSLGLSAADVTALACLRVAIHHVLRRKASRRPIFRVSDELRDYVMARIGSKPVETVLALYFNARHELLDDETVTLGTIGNVAFYPREIVRSGLERDAAAVVVAHGVLSEWPNPTSADYRDLQEFSAACYGVDIRVLDYLVVGRRGIFSCSQAGLMPRSGGPRSPSAGYDGIIKSELTPQVIIDVLTGWSNTDLGQVIDAAIAELNRRAGDPDFEDIDSERDDGDFEPPHFPASRC